MYVIIHSRFGVGIFAGFRAIGEVVGVHDVTIQFNFGFNIFHSTQLNLSLLKHGSRMAKT